MSQAKKLNKRTGDLRKRLSQIQRIQDRIGVADTETLLNLSRTLIEARKPIEFQLERYLLQRKKLELIRIQNRIQPYLENFNELNEYKMEDGIVTIQNGTKELFGIGHHLAGNFTPEIEPERQHFLEQLKETQNVCEKLREVLLSKQAIRALKDISPIDEINTLPQTFDLSHASETFNIQATLTAFSDSFEQLESEYRRIIDESEVSQKLIGSEF